MSGETDQVEEQTATPEQMTAAFEAGFSDDEDQATVTPPEPTPTPAPEYVQVTREDWDRINKSAAEVETIKATLGKMPDQIYGTFGRTLDRRLAELQQATPQGQAVEVSAEDFAEFKEQYPELAELTLKSLNKSLSKLKGTGGAPVDPKVFEDKAKEIRTGISAEVTDATLDAIVDGDWREEVNKPAYGEWIKTQPEDVRRLAESDKLRDAARLMRLYRKHLDTPAATPAPTSAPSPAAPTQPSMRQRQMAAAVAPRSEASAPAPKGKTPFEQGFEEDD